MNEEIRKAAVEVGVEWEYMSDGKHVIMAIRSAQAMREELARLREKLERAEANLENEREHVLDMREGVRLGGEYAREVERLRGFIQQEAEKIRGTAKHFEKIGGSGNPFAEILLKAVKLYEDALLPPVEGESKEGGENVDR